MDLQTHFQAPADYTGIKLQVPESVEHNINIIRRLPVQFLLLYIHITVSNKNNQ